MISSSELLACWARHRDDVAEFEDVNEWLAREGFETEALAELWKQQQRGAFTAMVLTKMTVAEAIAASFLGGFMQGWAAAREFA